MIIVFIQTDLPEPVAPDTRRWGIFSIADIITSPEMDLPMAKGIACFDLTKLFDEIISLKPTTSFWSFATSIPTWLLPGIGASILIPDVARLKDRSSARFTIFDTLTPLAGFSS